MLLNPLFHLQAATLQCKLS